MSDIKKEKKRSIGRRWSDFKGVKAKGVRSYIEL